MEGIDLVVMWFVIVVIVHLTTPTQNIQQVMTTGSIYKVISPFLTLVTLNRLRFASSTNESRFSSSIIKDMEEILYSNEMVNRLDESTSLTNIKRIQDQLGYTVHSKRSSGLCGLFGRHPIRKVSFYYIIFIIWFL